MKYFWPQLACMAFAVFTTNAWSQEDDSILVVPINELDQYWTVEHAVAPLYPLNSGRKRQDGCATIGFIIEPDGTTSDFQALASWPSKNFEPSAITALKQYRFTPSVENVSSQTVYTALTLIFLVDREHSSKKDTVYEDLARVCHSRSKLAGSGDP